MGKRTYDLAVIGGGPAGLAAATLAASRGVATVLLDEQDTPGGQIYRAVTETPVGNRAVLGQDYWYGKGLVEPFLHSGAEYRPRSIVWNVSRGLEIGVSRDGTAEILPARHVILATGATERPFPVPGWTLPGVLGAGAAQVLLKSSGLVADGRVVLAGTGPLLWLLAWQYLNAGARIDAILDTTPAGNRRAALRHLPDFLRSPYFGKGLRLLVEVRRRVRVISGVTDLRIEGGERAEAVTYRSTGIETRLPADVVLLHQGVQPDLNLAAASGCALEWDPIQLCWKPATDPWGATSVEGVSIAGDGAGIAGAVTAEHRGRLAALDTLLRLGRITPAAREQEAAPHRAALERAMRGRSVLDVLYTPPASMRIPTGDTILCRCEEVTAAQVEQAVSQGCTGPNQLKSFLRCGMGPCQGRMCGTTATELIAKVRGTTPAEVGHYRLRPPVKPITLAELATLPRSEEDVKAVYRS